ncbi:MAG: phosphatase PAP2 family protein [Pseudomonadota bacterium]|nr:phosphatase PAP2 family protein [Pseudomonadota bacterium]
MSKPKSPRPSPIERLDLNVSRAVALDREDPPGRWVRRFAELGDQPPLLALCGGVVAAGLVRRDERLARTGLRMLAAHSLATMAKTLVKNSINRTRPGALKDKKYRLEEGDSRDGRLRSMPSGHSAGTVAVAGAIAADYPRGLVPVSVISTAVMSAQLPSRNHFLTDVIAGAAIGFAATAAARLLIPAHDRADPAR